MPPRWLVFYCDICKVSLKYFFNLRHFKLNFLHYIHYIFMFYYFLFINLAYFIFVVYMISTRYTLT